MNIKKSIFLIGLVCFASINFYWIWTHRGVFCYGKSCNNLDPINQECDRDANTILKEKVKEITIQLRYSSKCNASWTKAFVPSGSRLYVEDTHDNKYGYDYVVPVDNLSTEYFGNMGEGRKLKACVRLPNNQNLCTKLAS
jgi:hypothetical protein